TTGKISTIAGTGIPGFSGDNGAANVAAIDSPVSIVVDAQGVVYFCDGNNNLVRKIDQKTGIIAPFAGSGNFGFGDPRFDGDNGAATSARLVLPLSLTIEPSGNIVLITFLEFWRITIADGKIHVINADTDSGSSGDGGTLSSAIFRLV